MPKKQVRTCADAPTRPEDPAAALIAKARASANGLPPLSVEGVEALRKICEHNDAPETSHRTRVSLGAALEMLRTHYGWRGHNPKTLDRLCQRELGRKSWGTP